MPKKIEMNTDYSLVMATKNGEKFIAETLSSVLNQTLRPAQVIMVIDHATDDTVKVAKSVISDLEIYYSEGHGMVLATNLGISKVTSPYVAFLDHDDLWAPTKQEAQIEFLNQHLEFDVVCSGTRNFAKRIIDGKEIDTHRDFAAGRLFSASTFRTDCFTKFGQLDESQGHFQWLYEWWANATELGVKYAYLEEIHLLRRIHETNSWVSQTEVAHNQLLEMVRRHKKRNRETL